MTNMWWYSTSPSPTEDQPCSELGSLLPKTLEAHQLQGATYLASNSCPTNHHIHWPVDPRHPTYDCSCCADGSRPVLWHYKLLSLQPVVVAKPRTRPAQSSFCHVQQHLALPRSSENRTETSWNLSFCGSSASPTQAGCCASLSHSLGTCLSKPGLRPCKNWWYAWQPRSKTSADCWTNAWSGQTGAQWKWT